MLFKRFGLVFEANGNVVWNSGPEIRPISSHLTGLTDVHRAMVERLTQDIEKTFPSQAEQIVNTLRSALVMALEHCPEGYCQEELILKLFGGAKAIADHAAKPSVDATAHVATLITVVTTARENILRGFQTGTYNQQPVFA
jgi:hypothetical protein